MAQIIRAGAGTPPASIELERHILGLLILFPEHIPDVSPPLFYDTTNRRICEHLRVLYDTIPVADINLAILCEKIRDSKSNIEASVVSALLDGVQKSGEKDLDSIIKRLKDLEARRNVSHLASHLATHIQNLSADEIQDTLTRLREVKFDGDALRSKTLADELKSWVENSTGEFTLTEIHKTLNLNTRAERKHAATILARLIDSKKIQRTGKMHGHYRRIENDYAPINWKDAGMEPYPILYPLDVQDLALTFPMNIVIVAGSKDVGKTGFLLNLAARNMDMHEIHYFSSEMGETELKLRLSLFDHLRPEDWKVHFWERSDKFDDVIVPDALNIIDYLQVEDEFYAVGAMIRKIFDKLKTGVAIIGLQKDPESVMGRGKWFSAEKARIYITLDHHRLSIVCGKNRTNPSVNPVGMSREFKLLHGWDFIPQTGWVYEPARGQYQRTDTKQVKSGFKF